jgi:hypothetical protein
VDGIVELAKLFKERDNRPYLGPQVGIVVSPLPDIKVRLGDKILLTKDHLIIASHLVSIESKGYQQETNSIVFQGDIPGADDDASNNIGTIKFYDGTPAGETKTVMEININRGTFLKAFFELKPGDEVILIPSADGQTYFLVDKAVRP